MVSIVALGISLAFNAVLVCVFLCFFGLTLLEVCVSCTIGPLVSVLSYAQKNYMPRCINTMGRYVKQCCCCIPTPTQEMKAFTHMIENGGLEGKEIEAACKLRAKNMNDPEKTTDENEVANVDLSDSDTRVTIS